MTTDGPATGRENSQRTYDRRRARSAAETLANIPPNRWDDVTRQIILTLATLCAPSRIDDALEAFDGQPADHLIEITCTCDGGFMSCRACHGEEAMTTPLPSAMCQSGHAHGDAGMAAACDALPRAVAGTWEDMPEGTVRLEEAIGAELLRMGLMPDNKLESKRLAACRRVCGGEPTERADDDHAEGCPYRAIEDAARARRAR